MNGYEFDKNISVGNSSYGELPGLSSKVPSKNSRKIIAGVDEAGRGPLAGPVVTAAVILPLFPQIKGLNDSKMLTEDQREKLFVQIRRTAISYSVKIIEPTEIDQMNILAATMLGMRESIQRLRVQPDLVLIDGNQKPMSGLKEMTIVKGDAKSAAIMAASILAKVTRDRIMNEAHEEFPQYGFLEHKGYGVPIHLENIKKHGPCPIHRKSFEPIKSMFYQQKPQELFA